MINWITFDSSWFPDGRLETAWFHRNGLNKKESRCVNISIITDPFIYLGIWWWCALLLHPGGHKEAGPEGSLPLRPMRVTSSAVSTGQAHQHLLLHCLQHHPDQAAGCEDGGWKLAKLSDGLHGGAWTTHHSPSIKEQTTCGAASAKIREGDSFSLPQPG